MKWTLDQERALKDVPAWIRNGEAPVYRLFGYAGTGKTTLLNAVAQTIRGTIIFAAYTGKAAAVMRAKGCEGATTLHALLYRPVFSAAGILTGYEPNPDSPAKRARLLIIDEGSMIGPTIARDLLKLDVKLLVTGDPGQLSPINDEMGFFMQTRPNIMLQEVQRQARDNPIIQLATRVREGLSLKPGLYGDSRVLATHLLDWATLQSADQLLVGLNTTRQIYNARMREILLGRNDPLPVQGDRVLCLRNNRPKGFFNGMLGRVSDADGLLPSGRIALRITLDDYQAPIPASVPTTFFELGGREEEKLAQHPKADAFTYGYALTVHKAQGSQWNNVVLFDESDTFTEDRRRWLYTGLTRAAERVTVAL